jgi:hypothetical protein
MRMPKNSASRTAHPISCELRCRLDSDAVSKKALHHSRSLNGTPCMKSEQKPFRCVRVCAKPLNKGECGRGNQLVNGNDEPSRWIAVIAAEIPAIDELYFADF